jgi:uncharacterized protein (DUF849 family)
VASVERKVVISCAATGAIRAPSMSPYLPVLPDEIVANALGAAEAGTAVLPLHAGESHNGRPHQTIEAFGGLLSRIKPQTKAAINITTGDSPLMRVGERVKPAEFSSLTRRATARQQSSREEKP